MLGRNHQGLVSNVLKDSLTNEVVKRTGEPGSKVVRLLSGELERDLVCSAGLLSKASLHIPKPLVTPHT